MRRDEFGLVVSPTDLTKFLACAHVTTLDLQVADRRRSKPYSPPDELLQLLFAKGIEHEQRYLAQLRRHHDVVEIADEGRSPAERAAETEAAIRAGAEIIYQAAFCHDNRVGYADFLVRADDRRYDVADTKLARRLTVPALLQMATYGEHLRRLQGEPPRTLTVIAGDGEAHPYPFVDVEAYARHVTARFEAFVDDPWPTAPQPVAYCDQCRWRQTCRREWRDADDLTFVAFLTRRQRDLLIRADIDTTAHLAVTRPDELPRPISRGTRERLVQQAALQVRERDDHQPHYELLAPAEGTGLLALPEPDPADLYLDFESDRWVEPDGLEYLAGVGDANGVVDALWAHDPAEERALTETLVDRILARWREHPGLHVYHYAPYEPSALKRLVQRHGTREADLDILLRAEVFVDLYAVVRQGLRVSKESYSIKKLEHFYWSAPRHENEAVADAVSSVLAYEQYLLDGDTAHLDAVQAYNRDDVESTRALHQWLEERRTELSQANNTTFARPVRGSGDTAEPTDAERAEQRLADDLLAAGRPLLAGLVGYHRREARPQWWDFFRYHDLADDELVDDPTPIGQLEPPTYVRAVQRSRVWRYAFPPQETKLRAGDNVCDVDERKAVGSIVGMDAADGWVEIKIGATREAPTVRGLQTSEPVHTTAARASLQAVARAAFDGEDCLGLRLVDRRVPTGLPQLPGETPPESLVRIGRGLDGDVLAVQGPPGTGKSHNAAVLIQALLDQGKTVGVTALSHSVIGQLLAKTKRPALQKATVEQASDGPLVEASDNNAAVDAALRDGTHRLVGGTSWLWSRPGMANTVDVLIVDEAGQFSLADAVAVSRAARSMVLLGDPQQLTQPRQAEHPHGAGVSALEHLLAGHDTIPPDRGIFFDRTYRMHPDVNRFVSLVSYESRLENQPETARQRIHDAGPWSGSGLRWVPVTHHDNATSSPEEASVVAGIVDELLLGEWVDQHGERRPVTAEDILIVAPFNVQVGVLRETVRVPGLRIGTVDKFQGREGAVVIYSMTSSTAADAPRGLGFLYDTHRLNVAISRARAMAIMVGSPELLNGEATRAEQVRLLNAHCRFVEMATTVRP